MSHKYTCLIHVCLIQVRVFVQPETVNRATLTSATLERRQASRAPDHRPSTARSGASVRSKRAPASRRATPEAIVRTDQEQIEIIDLDAERVVEKAEPRQFRGETEPNPLTFGLDLEGEFDFDADIDGILN